ncbi:unnamed protein product [Caenorhabditis angaria]|uniref:Domain of unknown function DX domain-containing protein n=1 Tax=Caenorhabditis angaria TaxID=860376 RepID=A0A9P1N0Z7_9PELO|nr:unnamed protein product [Caenorhabditis angaria]
MKTTLFLIIVCITCMILADLCAQSYIDAFNQDECSGSSECKTKLGAVGKCQTQTYIASRCCPNISHPDDFQSNTKCNESQRFQGKLLYCKDGYTYHVGTTHFKANTKSSILCTHTSNCTKGSYCVDYSTVGARCYVIDPPEKDDNTMLIIIIVVVVVFLILVVGITVGFIVWRKSKKGKGQNKSSTETGDSGKKRKKGSKA